MKTVGEVAAIRPGVFGAATRAGGRGERPAAGAPPFPQAWPGRHSGAKKHMALDIHLQKQSESRSPVVYCLLLHLASSQTFVTAATHSLFTCKGSFILRGTKGRA